MPQPVETPSDETPYLRAGVATGLVATAVGTVLASVVAAVSGATALGALRTGARAWVVPLGSGLRVDDVDVTVVPLGGTLVVALLVALVARAVLTAPVDEPGPYAATVAGAAGLLAGLLATVSDTSDVSTGAVRAAFGGFVVGGLAAGWVAGRGRPDVPWLPERPALAAVGRGAVDATLVLLGACSVVVLVLLAGSLPRAAELWASLDPGPLGGLSLGIVCLLAVPTLVLWTVAVVLGPGVQLGTDTSLDLTGAYLGQVPGLPVLAALPEPGAFPDQVVLLGLLPVLAGVLAGWRMTVPAATPLLHRVGLGAGAGASAGLLVGVLAVLSSGAVGPGRMAEVGPSGLAVVAAGVAVLAAGGAVGAGSAHYRGGRAEQPDREGRRPRLRLGDQPAGPDRRGGPGRDDAGPDGPGRRPSLRRPRRGRGGRP